MVDPISIIIPAFNEEAGLPEVLRRLSTVLADRPHEIIVINDGSSDHTAMIAHATGVRVITNPINMGYGFSLKRGFKTAANECVVMIDADGTYPIEKIPELIAGYEKGFDMVVAARQGKEYYSSFTKRVARYVFKLASEYVVGKKIPDINSGLRVIRRSKIMPHLPDLSNAFSFTASTTLIFFLQHYFICYIPIEYRARQGTTKVRYFRDALRTLQIMVDIIAMYNPIKLFLFIASLPWTIGIAVTFYGVLTREPRLIGKILALFLFGIALLSLGFIATVFRKKARND